MSLLRQQGVQDVGEVDKAFLEPSGQLSVFQASQDEQKQTESTVPGDYTRRGGT